MSRLHPMRITVPELPWHDVVPSSDLFDNVDMKLAYDELPLEERKMLGLWLIGLSQDEIAQKMDTYQQDISRKLGEITNKLRKKGLDVYVL